MNQGVGQTLRHGRFAPRQVHHPGFRLIALILGRQVDEAFGGVGTSVEHHVFHRVTQLARDIVIDRQVARIDNRHVEPGANGVIEENAVNGAPHRLITPEREGDVRHPARNPSTGQGLLDAARRLDKVEGVTVVLFNAGGDRENIGVEDNVFRRKIELLRQQTIGPGANLDLPICRIGLSGLIKRHDHHSGAIALTGARVFQKCRLASLERD